MRIKSQNRTKIAGLIVAIVAASTLYVTTAQAGLFFPQGHFLAPEPGWKFPDPPQVPGKEYSNHNDRNAAPAHTPDNGQVIYWDGAGGTTNGTDFVDFLIQENDPQVDALANRNDVLFDAVTSNGATLLFSTDDDPNIWFEHVSGFTHIWAHGTGDPNNIDQAGFPEDVDALEVWGPANPAAALEDRVNAAEPVVDPIAGDANRLSLDQSTLTDPGFTTAVFDSNGNEIFSTADIADAIGRPDLADIIDLDAMMMSDLDIIFSIDPIDIFDGGEIWVWNGITAGGATFLSHGGHVWNTAFHVADSFGTASENINALEAVAIPEPTTLALLSLGFAGLGFAQRKMTSYFTPGGRIS